MAMLSRARSHRGSPHSARVPRMREAGRTPGGLSGFPPQGRGRLPFRASERAVDEGSARRGCAAARGARVAATGEDADARRAALRCLAPVGTRLRRALRHAFRVRATARDESCLATRGLRSALDHGSPATLIDQGCPRLLRRPLAVLTVVRRTRTVT